MIVHNERLQLLVKVKVKFQFSLIKSPVRYFLKLSVFYKLSYGYTSKNQAKISLEYLEIVNFQHLISNASRLYKEKMYGQNEGNNEEMGIKRLLIFGIQTD